MHLKCNENENKLLKILLTSEKSESGFIAHTELNAEDFP